MRVFPSRKAGRHIKESLSDNDYYNDIEKRIEYVKSITQGMESMFGVVMLKALETMEMNATENLIAKRNESDSRAEIKLARFVKATLLGYVSEQESLENAIKQYQEMENGESYD